MKLGMKLKLTGLGLLIGLSFAGGILVGMKVDTDVVIKGKIKQTTRRGGSSEIKDVTSHFNVRKQTRQEKREERKQKRLERKNN